MSAQIIPFPTLPVADQAQQAMVAELGALDNLSPGLIESARDLQQIIKEEWQYSSEAIRYRLVAAFSRLVCLNDCNIKEFREGLKGGLRN